MSSGIAGERHPAERALALAEERPDERRHEAGIAEVGDTRILRFAAEVVAVVEENGPGALELEHRAHLRGDRLVGARADRPRGLARAERRASSDGELRRDVAVDHVVGGGLIGHDVEADAAPDELGMDRGGVAVQRDRDRLAASARLVSPPERFVQRCRGPVDVAEPEPPLDALAVDLDEEADTAVQGDGERLRAAHAPEAGGEHQAAGQRAAAEVLPRAGAERLVGALQDALGADVDPGAGRHLAVHRQPHRLVVA